VSGERHRERRASRAGVTEEVCRECDQELGLVREARLFAAYYRERRTRLFVTAVNHSIK